MKSKITFLFLLLSIIFFNAQSNLNEHLSDFSSVSFTYKHDKKWSAYLELQERSIEDFSTIDYYEVKGGIGYNFNKNNQAFLGLGRYGTYSNNRISKEELRFWLQYTFSHYYQKLKLDHRIRLEERNFHNPVSNINTNEERFRYRLALTYPLNNDKLGSKTFFVNAFEETFFGKKEPNFKRNRIFGGFGYQFNDYVVTNLGYLWQREFGTTSNRNLHFLYFGVNFTFDRLKYKETHPINVAD